MTCIVVLKLSQFYALPIGELQWHNKNKDLAYFHNFLLCKIRCLNSPRLYNSPHRNLKRKKYMTIERILKCVNLCVCI